METNFATEEEEAETILAIAELDYKTKDGQSVQTKNRLQYLNDSDMGQILILTLSLWGERIVFASCLA